MESKINPHSQILFFDGVCHLCNGFVDFMIQNEKKESPLLYAPLQGETAALYLSEKERKSLQSVIFYNQGQILKEDTAVLALRPYLKFPWGSILAMGHMVPGTFRQKLYQWVARNRIQWFGEKDSCRLPRPEERQKLWP